MLQQKNGKKISEFLAFSLKKYAYKCRGETIVLREEMLLSLKDLNMCVSLRSQTTEVLRACGYANNYSFEKTVPKTVFLLPN